MKPAAARANAPLVISFPPRKSILCAKGLARGSPKPQETSSLRPASNFLKTNDGWHRASESGAYSTQEGQCPCQAGGGLSDNRTACPSSLEVLTEPGALLDALQVEPARLLVAPLANHLNPEKLGSGGCTIFGQSRGGLG